MPYDIFRRPEDEKEKPILAPTQGYGGGGRMLAGGGGAPGQPAGALGGGYNTGRFVSFDRILGANTGGAQQMGNQVAGNVQAKADYAQQQNTSLVQGGGPTKVKQTPTPGPQAPTGEGTTIGDWEAWSTGATSTPQTRQVAGYGGDLIATTQSAQAANRDAQAALKATSTQGGLEGLAQGQYGKNAGYGSGHSTFDAALTGAAMGGRFGDLRSRFAGLEGALNTGIKTNQETASAYRTPTHYSTKITDSNDERLAAQGYSNTPAPGETGVEFQDRMRRMEGRARGEM